MCFDFYYARMAFAQTAFRTELRQLTKYQPFHLFKGFSHGMPMEEDTNRFQLPDWLKRFWNAHYQFAY